MKSVLLPVYLLIYVTLFGQQELTLHFSRSLLQSQSTNPAIRFDQRAIVGLPSAVFNYGNSAFSYADLVKRDPASDSTMLDVDNILSKMQDENILQVQAHIDLLSVYFTFNPWVFTIGMSEKYEFSLSYPKNLIDLLWNGNAQFIGQQVEIGPTINAMAYKELSLNIGRSFGNLDAGVRLKLLEGMANVHSQGNNIGLLTSTDNFATSLSTDYAIRSGGNENFGQEAVKPLSTFENPGFGLDFGIVYNHDDKWSFSASVLDIGFISWRENVRINKSNGTFAYSGIDVNDFIDEGAFDFERYEDSLESLYFVEEQAERYSSGLTTDLIVSWMYELNERSDIGAMARFEFFDGVRPALAIYADREFFDLMNIGLTYAYKNTRFDNLGLSLSGGPKWATFFMITDNLFTVFRMRKGRNVNLRCGININLYKKPNDSGESGKTEEPQE